MVSEGTTLEQAKPTLAPPKPQPGAGETKSGAVEPGNLPGPGKTEVPAKPAAPEASKTGLEPSLDSGLLTILVPEGAKVAINGYETRSQGTHRQYVSTGLAAGKVYPYTVTVRIPRASQGTVQDSVAPQWETRVETVYLEAGARLSLNFDRVKNTVLMARGQ